MCVIETIIYQLKTQFIMKTKLSIYQISKHIFYLLLAAGLFYACDAPEPHCGKWKLYVSNGWSGGVIVCDSLFMSSDTTAIVWIDGQKSTVHSPRMMPSFQPCR
jgi:hypothetical protein